MYAITKQNAIGAIKIIVITIAIIIVAAAIISMPGCLAFGEGNGISTNWLNFGYSS